jgi:LmbE family N-acetylglucosaminyl deacetylase
MKILYIFPHPDDESFGPASVIYKQHRQNYEVYLLTLTKGEATKQRLKYGYNEKEMGEKRFGEMQNVAGILKLSGLTVLDLPDSKLKEIDPRIIESEIKNHITQIKPDVIVTYAVHGISGFHDHLVCHAAVKRVYCELKDNAPYLKRLAFFTLNKELSESQNHFKLNFSAEEEIDCVIEVELQDIEKNIQALDCYITYSDTIANTKIKEHLNKKVCFEIFMEKHNPKLTDLFQNLN